MGGTSTIYDVQVKYATTGNAGAELEKIAHSAEKASHSTELLKRGLEMLGAYELFSKGKEYFIGFNSTMEQATASIAAQEKMLVGGAWANALQNSKALIKDYQQAAKASINTTEEFVTMHKTVAGAGYRLGMTNKELKELTVGAMRLGTAMGESAQYVGLELKEMMSGVINARQRVPAFLLSAANVSMEKFRAMNEKQKRETMLTALNNPALGMMAKEVEFSWKGVTSTLKDNLQLMLGADGKEFFEGLKGEVRSWNEWIDEHPKLLAEYGKKFSEALMKGFKLVRGLVTDLAPLMKDIFGVAHMVGAFMLRHEKLLLSIASAFLVLKGIGAVGGAAGAIAASVAGLASKIALLGTGSANTAAGLSSLGSALFGTTGAIAGVAALAVAAFAFSAWVMSETKKERELREAQEKTTASRADWIQGNKGIKDIEEERKRLGLNASTELYHQQETKLAELVKRRERGRSTLLQELAAAGIVGGSVDPGQGVLYGRSKEAERLFKERTEAAYKAGQIDMSQYAHAGYLLGAVRDLFGGESKMYLPFEKHEEAKEDTSIRPHKTEVNVTIQRIEVASPDPDRFVFGAVEAFRQIAANPVTAETALRGM